MTNIFLSYRSEIEDWRCGLAQLLHPVPVPDDALACPVFVRGMEGVVLCIGTDRRCDVHSTVLGIRPGKDGWLHIYCPSSDSCADGGTLWCQVVSYSTGRLRFAEVCVKNTLHFVI